MTVPEPAAEFHEHPTRVVVASTSEVKLDAVADTFRNMGKDVYVVQDGENSEEVARRYLDQKNVVVIMGVPVKSGINEQPFDYTPNDEDYMVTGESTGGGMLETLRGAKFRSENAQHYKPVPFGSLGANFYVAAIENGIFWENGKYIDRGVIVLKTQDHKGIYYDHVYYTKGVEFEPEFVESSRDDSHFKKTAGKIMAEVELRPPFWPQREGLIERHNDPHADICGHSRSEILEETMLRAFQEQLSVSPVEDTTHPQREVLAKTPVFEDKLVAYRKQSKVEHAVHPKMKELGASAHAALLHGIDSVRHLGHRKGRGESTPGVRE